LTMNEKWCIINIMSIDYKFKESEVLKELQAYIDFTYDSHYSKTKQQAMEFIDECGHGEGFCMGNILKYAQRYGRKDGHNKADLMKILHYGVIMLHIHGEKYEIEQ